MAHLLPIPCPVKLGTLKSESLEARLHEYVKQGNHVKVKKLLKKGISADSINSLGQTPLFTAALLGIGKVVSVLLDYGSDPNHRCHDGSTPVHAAAFSGNQSILSKLLDAGGDLRVHDRNGRNPQSWAVTAGKESSAQMLEFIQRCTSHMQAIVQNYSIDLLRKVDSPRALVSSPSKFVGIKQGTADKILRRGSSAPQNIYSFGFGKVYLTGSRQLGYLASLPIIADKEVVQADDEPTFSFPAGPYMTMTNLMWGGSRVTVKELNMKPHQHCSKLRLSDLLLAEQEHSSQLRHPHLLQLMAVCLSSDLEKTRLVFERVTFGSLYSILHERRSEFPIVHMETLVHLLLQVNDGLRFLHSHGFIHRTVSSYAVVVVLAGEAKLTNLEYMIESKDGGEHSDLTRLPIPSQLYKWCAPEVILQRTATTKSDIYSFCAVMQEALTDTIPWDGFEGPDVKDLIVSGQWLEADARLPKPYYDIVKTGLESRQKQRTMNLQDIRYILKNDLKDLLESRRTRHGDSSGPSKAEARADINICLPSASAVSVKVEEELPEEEQEEEKPEEEQSVPCLPSGSFTVMRCAASAPRIEGAAVHQSQPALPAAQSGHLLTPKVQGGTSDRDESLCSFEINEIYTCYPEMCGDSTEEDTTSGPGQGSPRQPRTVPGDWAKALSPPLPARIQDGQTSCSEGGAISDSESEYTREEVTYMSQAYPGQQMVRFSSPRGRNTPWKGGHYFGKCVLNLKISQTLLQQARDSLCRTERKLDQLESFRKPQPQPCAVALNPIVRGYWEKDEGSAFGNLRAPCSGPSAFLWKAVGPPSVNYVPPPLRVMAMQRPLVIQPFQPMEPERRSQDTTCWSDCGLEAPKSPWSRGEVEPNYQLLHPGVTVRRKRNMSPQLWRGNLSAVDDGNRFSDGFVSKSTPEIYDDSVRREERRMAQSEWTTEVKQMARQAASGQLGLPPQYRLGEWTSESEGESIKDAFWSTSSKERLQFHQWNTEEGRLRADSGIGDHRLPCDRSEENAPEVALKRFVVPESQRTDGRGIQFPANEVLTECGLASRKSASLSVTAEDLCRLEELGPSLSPSLDVSEEFFTPDAEFFYCSSVPPGNAGPENSTAVEEEDLEITQDICSQEDDLETFQEICGRKECPTDAEQRGKLFPHCGAEAKHLPSKAPGEDLFTPAASTGTTQFVRPSKAPGEFREKEVSLIDIQDLSSIICEETLKATPYATPRNSHSPMDASTPLSPAQAPPRFSSTITKYKDYCVTIDTTGWGSREASLLGFSTFATACAQGKIVELPPTLQQPSDAVSKTGALSEPPGVQLHLQRGQKELEAPPSAQESQLQEVIPEQADPEDQEIKLDECKADGSLWNNDTLCLEEDTDRAHSSLDDVLEAVLRPVADSRNPRAEPSAPIKREPSHAHHGNIEMRDGAEDSFSESEGSAENVEGLS
ncbi:inactive serine/threonine-protein kinase TEX14 isoform X2 [Podarcis raffonei]|nr:inactive serine/threonine-protein kinase TEX14 isoform X2 [Podarcis raffonei]XP_053223928.1 inactive serine/threonine-protein kinase TEX14 isoform X2 [Podarcis raffonei]